MPRPAMTAVQFDASRARILAEAGKIIAEDGYAALSMRRLAAGIGLTAGALYRYFPTRQHVLVAYWAAALQELGEAFARIDQSGQGNLAIVEAMQMAYVDFALADIDRFRVLFVENDLGSFEEYAQENDAFAAYEILEKRVAGAIADGHLRHDLPAGVATKILWAAAHGVVALASNVQEMDFGDVRALSVLAIETALRGLSTGR